MPRQGAKHTLQRDGALLVLKEQKTATDKRFVPFVWPRNFVVLMKRQKAHRSRLPALEPHRKLPMSRLVVKATLGDDTRRVRVPPGSDWSWVRGNLKRAFGLDGPVRVQFVDEEGDMCTVDDQEGWADAIQCAMASKRGSRDAAAAVSLRVRLGAPASRTVPADAKRALALGVKTYAKKMPPRRPIMHPKALLRPDGPWPPVRGSLPPVLGADRKKSSASEDLGGWISIDAREGAPGQADPSPVTSVTFKVNGEKVAASKVNPRQTLASFLREELLLTGTKIGCGEGGCGACTVFVKYPGADKGAIINSCLRPVASLDGAEVTTIEGLGSEEKGLHPVQDKLAKCNGSQCGYCSPGMVMAMYGMLQRRDNKPTAAQMEDALQGNICRCTGYRPILEASRSFVDPSGGDAKARREAKRKAADEKSASMKSASPSDSDAESASTVSEPCAHEISDGTYTWYNPSALSDAAALYYECVKSATPTRLVCGNTSIGVVKYYKPKPEDKPTTFINVARLSDLRALQNDSGSMTVGAAVTLRELVDALNAAGTDKGGLMARHLHLVANHQVRNAGSWIGNLAMARGHPDFPSDVALVLYAGGATLTALDADMNKSTMSVQDYLALGESKAPLITQMTLDVSDSTGGFYNSYKVMGRHENCHAFVNAAFCVSMDGSNVSTARFAIGALQDGPFYCPKAAAALVGKPLTEGTLKAALAALAGELPTDADSKSQAAPPNYLLPPRAYRNSLALTLFYKFFLSAFTGLAKGTLPADLQSAATHYARPVSSASQNYDSDPSLAPVDTPIPKLAAPLQTSGEAKYTGDLPSPANTLFGGPVLSTMAKATIKSIDVSAAMALDGVERVLTAKDIKDIGGSNNAGIFPGDEPVFAENQVECKGQFVALVLAETQEIADEAAALVKVTYEAPETPAVIGIQAAIAAKSFLKPSKQASQMHPVVTRGDPDSAFSSCARVVSGTVSNMGQNHFYMETQSSLVEPDEGGRLSVQVSSQGPTAVRKQVSIVINKSANLIRAGTRRAGGAFGGKLTRNMPLATSLAVGVAVTGRPCRGQLDRQIDMASNGARHPNLCEYKVGFSQDGKIQAVTLDVFADAGYGVDDTFGLLDMLTTMADNAYYVPNFRVTSTACKTNQITNTDMRSPGVCSGVFFMEAVIDRVAAELKMDAAAVRMSNFYAADGSQKTPAGDPTTNITLQQVWSTLQSSADIVKRTAAVTAFNKANRWRKRGIYCTPSKYGITQRPYAMGVVINVCAEDGTIAVAHSGVEIGQGINTKVAQAVAYQLKVPISWIVITHNSTETVPNATLTGGSGTSETVVNAALRAAQQLNNRLKPIRADLGDDAKWDAVIDAAFNAGVNLSSQGYWGFGPQDGTQNFNPNYDYFVYAAACAEVELDVLTGEVQILRTDIVYDCGASLNQAVDVGQVEGAFVQSIGYYLTEKIVHSPDDGGVLTAGTWEYRPPSSKDIPQVFNITFIPTKNPVKLSTLGSKAVAEPPYQLGASVFFAAKSAVYAARADAGKSGFFALNAPATPVELQQACCVDPTRLVMS